MFAAQHSGSSHEIELVGDIDQFAAFDLDAPRIGNP
jgi:hypothetical protein